MSEHRGGRLLSDQPPLLSMPAPQVCDDPARDQLFMRGVAFGVPLSAGLWALIYLMVSRWI